MRRYRKIQGLTSTETSYHTTLQPGSTQSLPTGLKLSDLANAHGYGRLQSGGGLRRSNAALKNPTHATANSSQFASGDQNSISSTGYRDASGITRAAKGGGSGGGFLGPIENRMTESIDNVRNFGRKVKQIPKLSKRIAELQAELSRHNRRSEQHQPTGNSSSGKRTGTSGDKGHRFESAAPAVDSDRLTDGLAPRRRSSVIPEVSSSQAEESVSESQDYSRRPGSATSFLYSQGSYPQSGQATNSVACHNKSNVSPSLSLDSFQSIRRIGYAPIPLTAYRPGSQRHTDSFSREGSVIYRSGSKESLYSIPEGKQFPDPAADVIDSESLETERHSYCFGDNIDKMDLNGKPHYPSIPQHRSHNHNAVDRSVTDEPPPKPPRHRSAFSLTLPSTGLEKPHPESQPETTIIATKDTSTAVLPPRDFVSPNGHTHGSTCHQETQTASTQPSEYRTIGSMTDADEPSEPCGCQCCRKLSAANDIIKSGAAVAPTPVNRKNETGIVNKNNVLRCTEGTMTDPTPLPECAGCSAREMVIYTNTGTNAIPVVACDKAILTQIDVPCHTCQKRSLKVTYSIGINTANEMINLEPVSNDASTFTESVIITNRGTQSDAVLLYNIGCSTENPSFRNATVSPQIDDFLTVGILKTVGTNPDRARVATVGSNTNYCSGLVRNRSTTARTISVPVEEERHRDLAHQCVGTELKWMALVEEKRLEILRKLSPQDRPKFSRGVGTGSILYFDKGINTRLVDSQTMSGAPAPKTVTPPPPCPRPSGVRTLDACFGTDPPLTLNVALNTMPIEVHAVIERRNVAVATNRIATRNEFVNTDRGCSMQKGVVTDLRMRDVENIVSQWHQRMQDDNAILDRRLSQRSTLDDTTNKVRFRNRFQSEGNYLIQDSRHSMPTATSTADKTTYRDTKDRELDRELQSILASMSGMGTLKGITGEYCIRCGNDPNKSSRSQNADGYYRRPHSFCGPGGLQDVVPDNDPEPPVRYRLSQSRSSAENHILDKRRHYTWMR